MQSVKNMDGMSNQAGPTFEQDAQAIRDVLGSARVILCIGIHNG